VNPDAVVEPGALAVLAARVLDPAVGIATGCVVLADRPELLNSAGNEIHCTGMSWSGHFEERVADNLAERDVLAASGALCAVRREVWDRLGGFDETFFAYYEDAQLSLRSWQRGLRVVYVPQARIAHRYEFSRRHQKMELLERNRWQLVLTCYGWRLLLVTAPVLLSFEVAVLGMAVVQGWLPHKLRSLRWLATHRHDLRARRRQVQAARTVPDRNLVDLFAEDLQPGNVENPPGLSLLSGAYRAWWRVVRHLA
jgi:GT2 family glycosyltransferase